MPRCAIYARFSTDRQSANSAEDQIADCTNHAQRQGWDVVNVYTDAAISGASNQRPGMTAMLSDAAAGSFDIVLTEAIDRLARNQADIATIYQRLEFAQVRICTLSEGEVNELHIGLKGTMSALFLKDLADKIRRGQRGTVERGRVPGGVAYGYDVVHRLDAKGEPDRGLRTINIEQAEVVRRIYRDFVGGMSPKAIAHQLNREGIASPRGGEWRASGISGSRARGIGILHNPIYGGRYLYNRVRMVRDPETRKRISRVNASDQRVYVDMPELAIVDPTLWQAAQDEKDRRSIGTFQSQVRPRHLLSGIVRCSKCRGPMTIVGGGRMGCARSREAGTCDVVGTIARSEVEARVIAGISGSLLAPRAVELLVDEYRQSISASRVDVSSETAAIDRKIAKAEKAIGRLVASIETGAADFVEIREALAARKTERDHLVRQRADMRAVPTIVERPDIVQAYRTRIRNLARDLSTGQLSAEAVARMRDLIEVVEISKTNTGWDIEVLTSLGAVVALATNQKTKGRSRRSVQVVAEEGLEPPTPGL